jgi:putative tricarboxylic transport membrane protein
MERRSSKVKIMILVFITKVNTILFSMGVVGMKRIFILSAVAILTVPFLAEGQQKGWEPKKEISFVVPSSPGGGSDLNARMISNVAQKNKFSPYSFMVQNVPGGSGAVAFSQVFTSKGDPYTIMVLHSGQVMGSYVNKWDIKAEMLTYIATLAFDELTLGVKKDGPYKDIKSLLKAAKDKPETIKVGGAQRGNSDHLSFELLNKNTNSKFLYVSFNGSGEVMSALLGGHIDVGIFNPIECIRQIEAGNVIPLVTYAKKRLPGVFKNAPTFIELGYKDLQLTEVRAIAGPPNMPADAVKFYEEMFKKITQSPEWKKEYLDPNYLISNYLSAADTRKFFEGQIIVYKKVFTDVGLIK